MSSPDLEASLSLPLPCSSPAASNRVWCMLSSWWVGALVREGRAWLSGCVGPVNGSLRGGEGFGLRASSLEGGLGLMPFT